MNSVFIAIWLRKTSVMVLILGAEKFPKVKKVLSKLGLDKILTDKGKDDTNGQTAQPRTSVKTNIDSNNQDIPINDCEKESLVSINNLDISQRINLDLYYAYPHHQNIQSDSDELYAFILSQTILYQINSVTELN